MTLLSSIAVVAAEETHPLIAPAFVFPMIAVGVFLTLGAVCWSYRDVANRHAGRRPGGTDPHGH